MDLYIQIGVLLLFLAALALFIYIYTAPAQQFTAKINDTNQKINDRLVTVEGMDVAPFMNNTNTPGTTIYPIIRDAAAGKIAVLVQTKNSQGLVVNYGYQLRSANTTNVKMATFGHSDVGNKPAGKEGTDFERNFVTTAAELFANAGEGKEVGGTTTAKAVKFGTDKAHVIANGTTSEMIGKLLPDSGYVPGSISGTNNDNGNPNIFFADPTVDTKAASGTGRTFASTGFMYTDQVIKRDMPVNDNFSYADNQGSMYRFDKNSGYYTTLILNANSEIVGIYVEEHGVNPKSSALAHMMLNNGTITSLY